MNAPQGLTMGTTVTANTAFGQDYFFLLLSGGNVTTFNIATGNADTQNAEVITVVFQQDGTGSRTVGYGTMIAAAAVPTVTSTANKFTVVQFFFDIASQLWYTISSAHN